MSQIEQYKPPPFEAKVSSARYKSYVQEHRTDEAWELDALEPRVLRSLIHTSVAEYFDEGIWKDKQGKIRRLREGLRDEMLAPGFVKRAFKVE
jgi:hypothetical protein